MPTSADPSAGRNVALPDPEQGALFLEVLDTPWEPDVNDGLVSHVGDRQPLRRPAPPAARKMAGEPLQVPIDQLDDDPLHPRGDYPQERLDDLARDIAERGVLQAIVVAPPDARGRYRIRLGVQRWRAARLAGLATVPVAIRAQPCDGADQVAENLKRHGLSPLDLARFIRSRVELGESNATVAKKLAIDPTTVGHHLSLLDLPPVLAAALESGRCTSPRTLHELHKLHEAKPDEVATLLSGDVEITRDAVVALRDPAAAKPGTARPFHQAPLDPIADLIDRSQVLCNRLDRLLSRLASTAPDQLPLDQVAVLRQRLAAMALSLER